MSIHLYRYNKIIFNHKRKLNSSYKVVIFRTHFIAFYRLFDSVYFKQTSMRYNIHMCKQVYFES